MPALPTLTITDQAKYDRVVAAFESSPARYKAWLRNALQIEVIRRETRALQDSVNAEMAQKQAEIGAITDGAT
jgi:hypothetical protein